MFQSSPGLPVSPTPLQHSPQFQMRQPIVDQEAIFTTAAPAPGNYSQAWVVQLPDGTKVVYTSGQTGNNPVTDAVVAGGIYAEARVAASNIAAIVKAAGGGSEHIVGMTVFHSIPNANINRLNFELVKGLVREGRPPSYFSSVAAIPLPDEGTSVEIEAVAVIPAATSSSTLFKPALLSAGKVNKNYGDRSLIRHEQFCELVLTAEVGVDSTGNVPEDVGEQTSLALTNVRERLLECGASIPNIVKVTIFVENMARDKKQIEPPYVAFFEGHTLPARSFVEIRPFITTSQHSVKVAIGVIAILPAESTI